MAVIDKLTAKVTADTQDFSRGMDKVDRSLGNVRSGAVETSAALQALQGRTSSAANEMEQLDDQASDVSSTFAALTATTGGLGIQFGVLGASTTSLTTALAGLSAVAVPLGATFIGLAGAVASVAGAFTAVIGTGILAFGAKKAKQNREQLKTINARIGALKELKGGMAGLTEQQQKRLEQLKERREKVKETTSVMGALGEVMSNLQEEIAPLLIQFGKQFIPLIEDALAALPTLVENMINAVGGTEKFRQTLRRFGQILMRVLPAAVDLMFTIARAALPAINDAVTFLLNNGGAAFKAIKQTVVALLPELKALGAELLDLIGPLLKIGTAALDKVLLPALTKATDLIGKFLTQLSTLDSTASNLAFKSARQVLNKLGNVLNTIAKETRDAWKAVDATVVPIIKSFIRLVKNSLILQLKAVENLVATISGILQNDWTQAFNNAKQLANNVFKAIEKTLNNVVFVLQNIIKGVANLTSDFIAALDPVQRLKDATVAFAKALLNPLETARKIDEILVGIANTTYESILELAVDLQLLPDPPDEARRSAESVAERLREQTREKLPSGVSLAEVQRQERQRNREVARAAENIGVNQEVVQGVSQGPIDIAGRTSISEQERRDVIGSLEDTLGVELSLQQDVVVTAKSEEIENAFAAEVQEVILEERRNITRNTGSNRVP